jgi:HSP20 family protein
MTLIRWQPFQELETLQGQLNRIFDDMNRFPLDQPMTWKPAIELQNSDESLILKAEIPGMEGKDLDVRVTREAVAISGEHRYEKKAEDKGIFRSEFRYGKFSRVIPLPVAVQNDQVKADLSNGILTLTLPKVEAAKNRVVQVNLAESVETAPAIEAEASNQQAVNSETNDVWESQTAETAAV